MFGDMSRIGREPIKIPDGVDVQIEGRNLVVSGSKGQLEMTLSPQIKAEKTGSEILISAEKQDKFSRSLHGLNRSLVNNMVLGVTIGWTKNLEMVGVGYRVQGGGDTLTLSVGFSHPVIIKAPTGVTFTIVDNTKITVSGIDKKLVGQVAANIRATKPPEVYKGKGIRYAGEYVRKKPGKAGKAIGGAK